MLIRNSETIELDPLIMYHHNFSSNKGSLHIAGWRENPNTASTAFIPSLQTGYIQAFAFLFSTPLVSLCIDSSILKANWPLFLRGNSNCYSTAEEVTEKTTRRQKSRFKLV